MEIISNLNYIIDKYREGVLAHAYLIETNDIEKSLYELKEIIKHIFCQKEYKTNCRDCDLCRLIDTNNFPNLSIIEPEGSTIKKQQIEQLKQKLKSIPTYSKYNVYIIKNADKLNQSSANSMLKFLEEPSSQVIGFFLYSNKENSLLTIRSRCQIIKVKYEDVNSFEVTVDKLICDKIIKYLKTLETNADLCVLLNKTLVVDEILMEITMDSFFKQILAFYLEALNKNNAILQSQELSFLLQNDMQSLIKKTKIIADKLNRLQYNPNSQLLLDEFVIEMSEVYE